VSRHRAAWRATALPLRCFKRAAGGCDHAFDMPTDESSGSRPLPTPRARTRTHASRHLGCRAGSGAHPAASTRRVGISARSASCSGLEASPTLAGRQPPRRRHLPRPQAAPPRRPPPRPPLPPAQRSSGSCPPA
jgi:hypothetical protein